MKRTFSLLTVLLLTIAFSHSVNAQTNVTAKASIDAALDITKDGDIEFGTIPTTQTSNAVIDPKNGNTNVGTGTISSSTISIDGAGSTALNISWSSSDFSNTATGSSATLGFTPLVFGNTANNTGNSTSLESGDTPSTSAEGEYYLFLGGTIPGADINGAEGGDYETTVEVTIDYAS